MSRNSSGNFTLPSGNPVVGGTVINSTWANPTMTDIGTEITSSLDRSGRGGMLAKLANIDGTVAAPAITFTTELGSGIYRIGSNDFGISIGGILNTQYTPGIQTLHSASAAATIGPIHKVYRNSASPADSDFIGAYYFDGMNDAGQITTYASLEGQINDVTDGTEDGSLYLKAMIAGTLTTVLKIDSTGKVIADITATEINTGTLTATGLITATGGITSGSDIISDADSTDSIGSTAVRWLKGWFDTLTAGTLTIGSGSITDSSGAIDFGNENLVTTGTLGAGATTVSTLTAASGATVTAILDEDDMASDSPTALVTQQSIKAYVDAGGGGETLAQTLALGNTSGATDLVIDSGQAITANTINETTGAAGVTIDSVLIKDNTALAGTLLLGAGSITDSSGAIDFADENLVTTGTLGAGATTVTTLTATDDVTLTKAGANQLNVSDTLNGITTQIINTSSAGWIGTTTNQPFRLFSNNTLAVTIDTSQNATFASDVALSSGSLSVTTAASTHNYLDLDCTTTGFTTGVRLQNAGANTFLTYRNDAGNYAVYNYGTSVTSFQINASTDAATFAGDVINGGNVYGDSTTHNVVYSGGSSASLGSNIIMYAESHPSEAKDFVIRSSTTNILDWDDSASEWTMVGDLKLSSGDLNVNGAAGGHAVSRINAPAGSYAGIQYFAKSGVDKWEWFVSSSATDDFGLYNISTAKTTVLFDFITDAATFAGNVTTNGHILMAATKALYLDGGSNTYIQETSSDNVAIYTGGTVGFQLNGSQNATFAGDVTLTDGFIFTTNSANESAQTIASTHAAFSNNMIQNQMSRAANTPSTFLLNYSGGTSDVESYMRGDGNNFTDGSWNGGGADYAEYFSWLDGNPNNENRKGMAVTLEDGLIRQAVDGDNILGVVSRNPSVVGDNDIGRWKQKYLRDNHGAYLKEDYTVTEWTEVIPAVTEEYQRSIERVIEGENLVEVDVPESIDANGVVTPESKALVQQDLKETILLTYADGTAAMATRELEVASEVEHSYETDKIPEGLIVPADAVVISTDENEVSLDRRVLNPLFDPTQKYESREDRREWDTIGLMGKLRVNTGQPTMPNWIKMRDISDGVEEWFIK